MTVVGGLRDRLLKDSFYAIVDQALNTLGWLDSGRSHRPINLIEKPHGWDVPVAPNTVAVDFTGSEVSEWEVGSRLTSDVHIGYVEIFAENDSLGAHLSNDLRDWLRCRLQVDPVGVTFPIFDFRSGSTPPVIGHMDIDAVSSLRNAAATNDVWLRHWYRVRCEIRDIYAGDQSFSPPRPIGPAIPNPDLPPGSDLFPGGVGANPSLNLVPSPAVFPGAP
jgi:hypothetical protein